MENQKQIDLHNYYHFTNPEGAKKIKTSGKILAQDPHGGEANMPKGVYLTQVTPSNKTKKIVVNNYDDGVLVWSNYDKLAAKTDVAFCIPANKLVGVKKTTGTKRNEYIYPTDIPMQWVKEIYSD